jgi:hypothetical protein
VGTPLEDVAELLDRYPGCPVVGIAATPGHGILAVRLPSGTYWYDSTETDPVPPGPDLALHASALYGWLSRGHPASAWLTFHVQTGSAERTIVMQRTTEQQIVIRRQEGCAAGAEGSMRSQ